MLTCLSSGIIISLSLFYSSCISTEMPRASLTVSNILLDFTFYSLDLDKNNHINAKDLGLLGQISFEDGRVVAGTSIDQNAIFNLDFDQDKQISISEYRDGIARVVQFLKTYSAMSDQLNYYISIQTEGDKFNGTKLEKEVKGICNKAVIRLRGCPLDTPFFRRDWKIEVFQALISFYEETCHYILQMPDDLVEDGPPSVIAGNKDIRSSYQAITKCILMETKSCFERFKCTEAIGATIRNQIYGILKGQNAVEAAEKILNSSKNSKNGNNFSASALRTVSAKKSWEILKNAVTSSKSEASALSSDSSISNLYPLMAAFESENWMYGFALPILRLTRDIWDSQNNSSNYMVYPFIKDIGKAGPNIPSIYTEWSKKCFEFGTAEREMCPFGTAFEGSCSMDAFIFGSRPCKRTLMQDGCHALCISLSTGIDPAKVANGSISREVGAKTGLKKSETPVKTLEDCREKVCSSGKNCFVGNVPILNSDIRFHRRQIVCSTERIN